MSGRREQSSIQRKEKKVNGGYKNTDTWDDENRLNMVK
jgi:hypothetical protein